MARTINSPGVEIKEYDLSERSSLQAGTNILVQGFAAQGPTNQLIQITTKDELNDVYFGGVGPTNAAERYFYNACSEVLNSPATLFTVRLPYGENAGNGFSGEYMAIAFNGDNEDVSDKLPSEAEDPDVTLEELQSAISSFAKTWVPSYDSTAIDEITTPRELAEKLNGFEKYVCEKVYHQLTPHLIDTSEESEVTVTVVQNSFKQFAVDFLLAYSNDTVVIKEVHPLPLTRKQYEMIQLGVLDSTDTSEEAEALSVLKESVFFIVNKMQTSIDDNFQGYYVAVNDNYGAKLWNTLTNPDEARDSLNDGTINLIALDDSEPPNSVQDVIPEAQLDFSVKGMLADRILHTVPQRFGSTTDDACVAITTLRLYRDTTSQDPDRLTFSIPYLTTGSLNAYDLITDPSGYGTSPYFLEDRCKNLNPYVDAYVRPKWQTVKRVEFQLSEGDNAYHGVIWGFGTKMACTAQSPNRFIGNLPKKISNALSLIDNPQNEDLDIVLDAGLSTIWAYCATPVCNGDGGAEGSCEFDDAAYVSQDMIQSLMNGGGNVDSSSKLYLKWFDVYEKFNTFCSATRKDCIFISDPLRCIFVRGIDKKVSDLSGFIFTNDIIKTMKGLYDGRNSNYACTYANWAKKYDLYSGSDVWMPPSIFVAPIMARIDSNYFPWWAPFGLNNGLLTTIKDIAIRPNQAQCDTLYKLGINMFCYFHGDGFVVWGQKTLQYKESAFDRINVRRLFLTLERSTMKAMRYFVGEPNTDFTRTRAVQTLTPIFNIAKANSGCYDYRIVCSEVNNDENVIDRNEMVVDIYIKPVRTAEFICVNFYATKTSADFDELIG